MRDIQKAVGERIRRIREQTGISQETLADLCNLHRTYVGLIERGQRNLSLETLGRIAGALSVSVSELFTGIDNGFQSGPPPNPPTERNADDMKAHLATIREILVEAKLTTADAYEALYRANISKKRRLR